MTRRIVCLLFAFLFVCVAANVNVASADEVAAPTSTVVTESIVAAPCACAPSYDPCSPPVVFRRGFFGFYRPVTYYPVYPRYVRPLYPVSPAYPAYYW